MNASKPNSAKTFGLVVATIGFIVALVGLGTMLATGTVLTEEPGWPAVLVAGGLVASVAASTVALNS